LDKNNHKLSGKYIKVNSAPEGIEGYDINGNKLDGTYKKEEPCLKLFILRMDTD
jgi:hypothetical protein